MKTRLICAALGVCLSATSTAMGQTPHVQRPTPGSSSVDQPVLQQKIIAIQGHYVAPVTVQEQARNVQQGQLEDAAAVALDVGEYAIAVDDAKQASSLGYGSGKAQELLAAALNAQGKTQEALQAYQVMAGMGWNPPRVSLPYALLLLETRHWAQAVGSYNKALPLLSDGELMRANSHFSPAVLEPAALGTAIHIALGLTYNSSDSWGGHQQNDKALSEYTKALQLAPNSDLANFYYGYGLQRLGRKAQANAAFQKTVKMAKGEVKAAAEQALRKNKKPA